MAESILDRECWEFTAQWEGAVDHCYLDTAGVVTVGVGFALHSLQDVWKLPWSPNAQAACADWNIVKGQAKGHLASFYKRFCMARLPVAHMRPLFAAKMQGFQKLIAERWKLYDQPINAQVALSDLVWNVGPAGLNKFAKLHAAVMARDWETAAVESRRKGIGDARNIATGALFRALV